MDTSRLIYFFFLTVSFILAVVCKKKEKGLFVFQFLIGFSLLTEAVSTVLNNYGFLTFPLYHVYIPVEYSLWVIYFKSVNDKVFIKKLMIYSVPAFIVFSFISSLFINTYNQFPSVQINIEALLLISWATYTIFNIKINENLGILARPVFWICVAVLVYYCLSLPFLGFYNIVRNYLEEIQFYLLHVPNYILYTCLSIAFICSHRIKT